LGVFFLQKEYRREKVGGVTQKAIRLGAGQGPIPSCPKLSQKKNKLSEGGGKKKGE